MPQINLNRKIDITNVINFLEKLNKNSNLKKNDITLKDLIIKASHISSLSIKNFRNYFLNESIFYLKDFTIHYKNFSGFSQKMELLENKSIENYSENYLENFTEKNSENKSLQNNSENFQNLTKSFFLIEDAGDFDIKTVRPIISLENVF